MQLFVAEWHKGRRDANETERDAVEVQTTAKRGRPDGQDVRDDINAGAQRGNTCPRNQEKGVCPGWWDRKLIKFVGQKAPRAAGGVEKAEG